jgi:protein ImuA
MGTVHEFISPTAATAVVSNGFISGILATLMKSGLYCLWVSTKRSLFPPALHYFGIAPHQVIFVDVKRDKDALWVMEQGLRCTALAAVVAELSEINFTQSQRLQLAVEQSKVTGFIHRKRPQRTSPLACVARWHIKPIASQITDGLPGVGHPAWEVHLEKIRNGRPGKWHIGWQNNHFVPIYQNTTTKSILFTKERYA